MKYILILIVAVTPFLSPVERSETDCQTVMQQLSDNQQSVGVDIDNINALNEAIQSPDFDSATDGWMIDALDSSISDLVTDLNTGSMIEEQAHYAHCY